MRGLLLLRAWAAAPAAWAAHGYALWGDLKYPPDFPHFAYVNPQAPKGGELRLDLADVVADLEAIFDLMKWGPTSANCQPLRIVQCVLVQQFIQYRHADAVQTQPALEVAGKAARATGVRHLGLHLFQCAIRLQVQVKRGLAVRSDLFSPDRAERPAQGMTLQNSKMLKVGLTGEVIARQDVGAKPSPYSASRLPSSAYT